MKYGAIWSWMPGLRMRDCYASRFIGIGHCVSIWREVFTRRRLDGFGGEYRLVLFPHLDFRVAKLVKSFGLSENHRKS